MGAVAQSKKIEIQDLITISQDQSIYEAHKLMKQKWIRHLPVIDEHSEVVGIISERDINNIEYSGRKISEIMSVPVLWIDQEASVVQAAELMMEKKVSSVIVKDGLRVCGIITTDDLLRALVQERRNISPQSRLSLIIADPTLNRVIQSFADMGI